MSHNPKEAITLSYVFIGKYKLPKGLSYPLKRSILDEFLRREGIKNVTSVGYLAGASPQRCVVTARYHGPKHKHSLHTLNLSIHAVPSAIRRRVEELVVTSALPLLAEWLLSFSDDSLLRARTDHSTSFILEGNSAADLSRASGEGNDLRLVQRISTYAAAGC